MRNLFVALMILCASSSVFAQKYMTKTGHISFFSKAPMENIEAHNNQVSSIINTANGELVFSLLMKSFNFQKALMQEHFNEKYVESDKFPKAEFKGKITNLSSIDFKKEGPQAAEVAGTLTIHGVTKDATAKGTVEVKGGKLYVKATFPVTVADYNITIPAAVRENIAKVVDVTVDMVYDPMN